MRKLISAVTSLAMAATMASVVAPTAVSAEDTVKGFAIQAYAESGSKYATEGSAVTVSADDIAAGDVTVPCAVYLDEATASSNAISAQLSVRGGDGAGDIVFNYQDPTQAYFEEAQTYTLADGTAASTKQAITFAGTYNARRSMWTPHGHEEPACVKGQKAASTENYYIGYTWMDNGSAYTWAGTKSTDHPLFVFDVVLPKGTPAGEYELYFCDYNTDSTGKNNNPSCMIENSTSTTGRYITSDGSLTLKNMIITVEGEASGSTTTTTTATTTSTTTTTTTTTTPGDADMIFDFGEWTAKAGESIDVSVNLTAGDNKISALDLKFAFDEGIKWTAIDGLSMCLGDSTISGINYNLPGLNFSTLKNAEPINTDPDGGEVFYMTFEIDKDLAPGDYHIGLGEKREVYKDNTPFTYANVESINGIIHVVGDDDTT
ncbi:MAG: hypothetical protein IJM55_08650, partial [Ruminococcus sp.]|nr:hypothetical protein [Ruminococcus sp.]